MFDVYLSMLLIYIKRVLRYTSNKKCLANNLLDLRQRYY